MPFTRLAAALIAHRVCGSFVPPMHTINDTGINNNNRRKMPCDLIDKAMGGFRADAVALLQEQSRLCQFERGSSLYNQLDPSDSIYIVSSGCVIVERTNQSGDVTSYRIATRGDYLGHRSYFARESRSTAPRSITETQALRIPGAALDQAIELDPAISLYFARELARDDGPRLGAVLRSNRLLGIVRLAYLLHHLHERLEGEKTAAANIVRMPFTQNDLANMLDLRNETVSRLIHQLQDMGVLDFEQSPRRIVITDRAALTDIIRDYL